MEKGLKIFSYLPNPRVWKAEIAAKIAGIPVEVIGDKPSEIPNWLWDSEPKKLSDSDKKELKQFERTGKRGFSSSLYKKLLTMGEGASIYLEEYTRNLIGEEEQHQLELRKMLKDFS